MVKKITYVFLLTLEALYVNCKLHEPKNKKTEKCEFFSIKFNKKYGSYLYLNVHWIVYFSEKLHLF